VIINWLFDNLPLRITDGYYSTFSDNLLGTLFLILITALSGSLKLRAERGWVFENQFSAGL
jgi:hypothetical protein